jgi:acyl carrier protein
VVLVIVAGAIYLSTRYSTPTPKPAVSALTQQTTPATGAPVSQAKSTYLIGIQYGRDISSISVDGDEYTTCTEEGITCLGEKAISGKTISIPLQNGSKWSRIAVLISSTEYVEFARIVVSTQSDVIGLNYVEHRDGMFHNQIEFSKQFVYPISESQKPLWYPIDITFRKPIEKFPLTITVSANDQPAHSVTTYLQVPLPSSPSAQKANPTLPLSGHSQTLTPAPERNITIADRVTVIIAHRLHLKAGGVKSEDDFEVDLGASPTDVKLIMYDLQDEYGISIPKSDALKIKTVGEAIKYVEQRDKQ